MPPDIRSDRVGTRSMGVEGPEFDTRIKKGKKETEQDFPSGPVDKTLPSNGGLVSISLTGQPRSPMLLVQKFKNETEETQKLKDHKSYL